MDYGNDYGMDFNIQYRLKVIEKHANPVKKDALDMFLRAVKVAIKRRDKAITASNKIQLHYKMLQILQVAENYMNDDTTHL
jgi:hypothetical protein